MKLQGENYEIYANREKTAIDLCDYSIRNHICMGLLMWYSYGKGLDLSAFPNAQMLYPAAGVMMAYLITKKGDKNLPTAFYIFFVALTAVLVVCTAASVLAPQNMRSDEHAIFSVGNDHGVRYNRWQRYFLDSSSAIR